METAPHMRIETIGREQSPVIVIDGFVTDPAALAEIAAQAAFAPMGAHYPGVRAPVPPGCVAAFLVPVAPIIARTFGLPGSIGLIDAMFSLVTAAPASLRPIQRLPHFDGCEAERLAVLHYLGGCGAGGTAFYRHRSTGFETISPARLAPYDTALRADVARHGMPPAAYIAGDTAIFEQTARFEGRFNRALIYRGHLLHCAALPPETPLSADPRVGRLTVNTFLMGTPGPG